MVLSPLTVEDLIRLIADALDCTPEAVAPLASVVHAKTGGNPFFTIQFLTTLAEQRLLTFDHTAGRWTWRLDDIEAKGFTENVVELVLEKLHRLPESRAEHPATARMPWRQRASRQPRGGSAKRMKRSCMARYGRRLQAGLLLRQENAYSFPHDRVREAAYELHRRV